MNSLLRVALAVVLGVSGIAAANTLPRHEFDRAAALRVFHERITAYAALRQRVAEVVSGLGPSASVQSILRARAALASGIRAARPEAREGDIFTPAAADAVRGLIAKALTGVDTEAFLRDLYEEQEVLPGYRPRVHDTYPEWATHEVPIVLLEKLPLLPRPIQYRLVDHALVLWDANADLIIDVLPDAIPAPVS